MSIAVVVQTCDRYESYWAGFLHFMERHWDPAIDARIYLCNEERDVTLPPWCTQVKTGCGTFVENLKKSIKTVGEEEVFLMLEDFWPIAPMKKSLFEALRREFKEGDLDALQVSNYTSYYRLKPAGKTVEGKKLLEFEQESEWLFNLQARFWKSDALLNCLVEPEISEREVGSAITAEMASDRFVRENARIRVALFHYIWYPLSGVAHRGKMTEMGRELQNIMAIDRHVDDLFS